MISSTEEIHSCGKTLGTHLNQPHIHLIWLVGFAYPSEKYATVKLDHFPKDRGEKKYLKPPPSSYIMGMY